MLIIIYSNIYTIVFSRHDKIFNILLPFYLNLEIVLMGSWHLSTYLVVLNCGIRCNFKKKKMTANT